MLDKVEPMEGAHQRLRDLKEAGRPIILDSSAEAKAGGRAAVMIGDSTWDCM